MFKKIIALVLAMLMIAATFVGCGEKDGEDGEADTEASARVAMTLSLWMPTEEGTTDEAIALVEEAINDITRAQFDTAIELHLIPRSEYQAAIDARMAEIENAIENDKNADREEETLAPGAVEEETIVNELGITVKQYPSVGAKQMDIFLVKGYDKYVEYVDNMQIVQLDDELRSNSKILSSYIYPTFLEVAYRYGTFAIPNNHPVGTYEYLLVNKELVDKYDYHPDNLTSLLKCEDFIIDIGNQKLEGVVPLLDYVEPGNMVYWGLEEGEWSLLASQMTNASSHKQANTPKSVFTLGAYINTILLMKTFDELGYIGDGTLEEGEKFAVGVIEGNPKTIKEYEDEYYVTIYSNPMFVEEDVFGSMFAVSQYTKSTERAMEIITYLNTSTDLRTVLQYGVEGVHWEYEDDSKETIRRLNDDYQMNLLETGNVYMTYPGEGISMDEWEWGKQQNLDSISSPYMGFRSYVTDENRELLEDLAELSAEIKAEFDSCSAAEFKAYTNRLKAEHRDHELIKELTDPEVKHSLTAIYEEWFSTK